MCSPSGIAIIKYYACAKSIFEEYLTIWENAHYNYQILCVRAHVHTHTDQKKKRKKNPKKG